MIAASLKSDQSTNANDQVGRFLLKGKFYATPVALTAPAVETHLFA